MLLATAVLAQQPPSPGEEAPNYPHSPFHGARDGDGRIIPCRCRSGGQDYRLGDKVCMRTPVGTVLARCDLIDNNTSWIPTATPCEVSRLDDRGPSLAAVR